MGLTGPWAHANAESLSAMLDHAGIRNGIGQTFHLRARGSSGRGGSGLKGFLLHSSHLFIQSSVLMEGVSRGKRGGDTPPAPSLQGQDSGDAAPLRQAPE